MTRCPFNRFAQKMFDPLNSGDRKNSRIKLTKELKLKAELM